MKTALYKRKVLQTVDVKQTKAGLRHVARNTRRANVFKAVLGIATYTSNLILLHEHYLLEGRLDEGKKMASENTLEWIAYNLAIAAHNMKVKIPTSTKKIRHKGTKGSLLLELLGDAQALLETVSLELNVSGTKEEQLSEELSLHEVKTEQLQSYCYVFYQVCFAITGKPPAYIFSKYDVCV